MKKKPDPEAGLASRVLVLTQTDEDSSAICALLQQAGLACDTSSSLEDFGGKLEVGAGTAIITEEALLTGSTAFLREWVSSQPAWSDFPFIVLTAKDGKSPVQRNSSTIFELLQNVTLQERPVQTVTLISAVRSALRARHRQYELSKYIVGREQAEGRLEDLVRERTRQLQETNDHLKMALEATQMTTWEMELSGNSKLPFLIFEQFLRYTTLLPKWGRGAAKRHIVAEDQELFEGAFREAVGTGNFRVEFRVVWADDSLHWVAADGRLYRDGNGEPVRLAGTLRDITERKQIEENLRQTQKLEVIGQLTGGVAHDFNNLLTAVVGNIELAELRTRDKSLLGILRSAGVAAERGAKLTGQLLAFARRQHLAPRVVSLNELVSGMGDLLLQTIGAAIQIETLLEENLWPVLIDSTQLELVLLNLAINSRDAMPHGGRLTVGTKNISASDPARPASLPIADYVAIWVSDTGTGMPKNVMAKAFEPFFSTKDIGKGTGLGLSQVLGFAKQSGGDVRIDTRVGRGTTVTLFLPRTRASLPKTVLEEAQRPESSRGATILVVDDDAAVRELTVHALEALNYRVLEADSGPVALDLVRGNQPVDLILIDLVMPGMSGRDLATRLRVEHPNQVIVFMSGYDDLSGTDDPFADEMVIKKPFKLVELAAAVERALGEGHGTDPVWQVIPVGGGTKSL
jgi:signal transduction histidine kinase/CheY-like chemotaxis protein